MYELEQLIADLYAQLDHTVTVVDQSGEKVTTLPTESDVQKLLDEAVRQLYTEDVGNRLNIASLIIEKRPDNEYDVYKYVGTYT